MSVDPTNPDDTAPVDPSADEPAADELAPADAPAFAPAVGDVVRLDDPEQDGDEPRYALYVAEGSVVPLSAVQRYELQLYPTS